MNCRMPSFRKSRNLVFIVYVALSVSACEHTGLMRTPNIYLATNVDPFADIPADRQHVTVDLLYATDRQQDDTLEEPHGTGIQYGYHRSGSLAFGQATVALGEQVSWEDLHAASLTRRRDRRFVPALVDTKETGRFPAAQRTWVANGQQLQPDPQVAAANVAASETLSLQIQTALENSERKEVFIFIHGYNNQFYHAALTMAQLWHFMGRPGVPVIYSWPAGRGGLRGYTSDSESSKFTVYHLKQFLDTLANTPGLEKIHILAHSRGTDVATTAIRELMLVYEAEGKDTRKALKLGNLVLAAPDLDIEVVEQTLVAEGMIGIPERFTIYISPQDRALLLSSWMMDSVKRLGNLEGDSFNAKERETITTMPLLTFIKADVKSDITGHAYFWTNPAASSDLILLLRDNFSAGAEHGRPLIRRSKNYWILRDKYLLNEVEVP